jgi:osmoprotectant transport system ATP-binding protein
VQEAFELGDRICLLDKGKIVQMGKPEELLYHPADEYVTDFFEDQRFQLEVKMMGPEDYPALMKAFTHFKNRPNA